MTFPMILRRIPPTPIARKLEVFQEERVGIQPMLRWKLLILSLDRSS